MIVEENKKIEQKNIISEFFKEFSNNITSLQAIAIIAVILSHCRGIILTVNLGQDFFNYFAYFGVNIFVFLSGMLLTIKILSANSEIHSWKKWYKRRIIRIFPILILSTLFGILIEFILYDRKYDINSILIHMSGLQSIIINPNCLLIIPIHWFITFILSCYVLFPILFFFIKKNFKLTLIFSIFLYLIFVRFYYYIRVNVKELIYTFFQSEFCAYDAFMTRYFIFFFGMLTGFWIGKNFKKNMTILYKKKTIIATILILIVLNLITIIIQLDYYWWIYPNLYLTIYPMITIFSVFFFISFFKNKFALNKFLAIVGKESYENFLTQTILISIILFIQTIIQLNFIYILIIYIGSIVLAHPFYYIGNFIKKKEKSQKLVLIFSQSLIIYAIIAYFFYFFTPLEINDLFSILLYICSLIVMLIISNIKILAKFLQNK